MKLEGTGLQWIYGLGMGNVDCVARHELHSNLGSAFNNYGLIGLLLFGGVLRKLAQHVDFALPAYRCTAHWPAAKPCRVGFHVGFGSADA